MLYFCNGRLEDLTPCGELVAEEFGRCPDHIGRIDHVMLFFCNGDDDGQPCRNPVTSEGDKCRAHREPDDGPDGGQQKRKRLLGDLKRVAAGMLGGMVLPGIGYATDICQIVQNYCSSLGLFVQSIELIAYGRTLEGEPLDERAKRLAWDVMQADFENRLYSLEITDEMIDLAYLQLRGTETILNELLARDALEGGQVAEMVGS